MEHQEIVQPPLTPLRVGVICSETNREDLLHYKDELIKINKKLGWRVELILFGYDGSDGKKNWLKGVNFEYVKPVSIIHYPQQLRSLNLDLVFIPLINNIHNVTSETYGKYLETGLFGIPIITTRIYPYNGIIADKINGFLYKDKSELITYLDFLHTQRDLIKTVGNNAYNNVMSEYNYSPENIEEVSKLFA